MQTCEILKQIYFRQNKSSFILFLLIAFAYQNTFAQHFKIFGNFRELSFIQTTPPSTAAPW